MKKKKRYSRMFILLSLSFCFLNIFLLESIFGAPVDFPQKEITIIVNFGPGGSRDILARGVGNTLSKYLGMPVVVMNTPGAGGARGMINLYNSAPDGYTMGVGMGTDIIDQIFQKREYDNKKFIFLGRAQSSPTFYFVKSDSPLRSVKDFKSFGKPIRISTFSLTANSTVVSMILANREGFPLAVIGGYQSGQAQNLALLRGEAEICGNTVATAKPFRGQIRPILAIDTKRSPDFPDIPTVGEIGYPELGVFANDMWFMVPPGVPKDRVQILEGALMKTLKDPEFLAWAKEAGVEVGPLSGEEMTKMVFGLFDVFKQYKGDVEKYLKKVN